MAVDSGIASERLHMAVGLQASRAQAGKKQHLQRKAPAHQIWHRGDTDLSGSCGNHQHSTCELQILCGTELTFQMRPDILSHGSMGL